MRDLQKTIDYVERGMLRGLERPLPARGTTMPPPSAPSASVPSSKSPKSSIRAWHAPVSAATETPYPEQIFKPKSRLAMTTITAPTTTAPTAPTSTTTAATAPQPRGCTTTQLTLTARSIKVTVQLDPAEIKALPSLHDQERVKLEVACEGKLYSADIATKSLRKAKATISANGTENVFGMVQGKLKGNEIVECGLVAQVKTPKPTTA
jgi:hypothetical protein